MFENKTILSLHFQATEALPITITVDGESIFDETVSVPDIMPPIVFSKDLTLSSGTHTVECIDGKRDRKLSFDIESPHDRSILIRIEDDATDNGYEVSAEEMHFK